MTPAAHQAGSERRPPGLARAVAAEPRRRRDARSAAPHRAATYTCDPMLGFLNRFVDSNERELRRIQPIIDHINSLEPEFESMSDDEIRARIAEIREEVRAAATTDEPSEDELTHPELERRRELAKARRKREQERVQKALDDVLPEVFAAGREAMKR